MTYAITRYTKKQIALMDTQTLAHSVRLHTDRMYTDCIKAYAEWRDAPMEAKDRMLVRIEEATKKLDDYIEEQRAMFTNRGMNPDLAFKNAIVPTGEVNKNGVEVMRIIQREHSIAPFEDNAEPVSREDEREMNEGPSWESDEDWEALDEQ